MRGESAIRRLCFVLGFSVELALPWCFAASPPVPLEREAPWRIADFAQDAGVSRRMIFDLAFQTNNTAWFAVSDGLYRYDGYHWQRFTSTNGLPSSVVRTVSVTRDGSVWVGTDKGCGVFDGTRFDSRGTEGRLAGPNVRRIVETGDGSLWFCCDRWPDAGVSGGLTQLKNGAFHSFGMVDGLPDDHVLNLFEQSRAPGRLVVLTGGGPAVRSGERWVPIPDGGYPPRDHTWTMQETPDGLVFAQGYRGTLVWGGDQWVAIQDATQPRTTPFCVTRDGSIVKGVQEDGAKVWFTRWNGETFEQASGEITHPGADLHVMRQAPDGSIWAVGRGTLLRWEYLPGMWDARPDLPFPRLEDRQKRLWFANEIRATVMHGDQLDHLPGMRAPLAEDREGAIWSAGATGIFRWHEGTLSQFPVQTCGVAQLQRVVVDSSGGVWFAGLDSNDAHVMAGYVRNEWKRFSPAQLQKRNISSLIADPQKEGAWVALYDPASHASEIVKIDSQGLRKVEVEGGLPQTRLPLLCASQSHLYLSGYNGLWQSALQERLRFVQNQSDAGSRISLSASLGDITAFVTQETVDGKAAILVKRGEVWLEQRTSYADSLWLGKSGCLIVGDGPGFVLWQTRDWDVPTYANLPTDSTILSALLSSSGDYWVGTPEGVLHLRPGQQPPDTVLIGPATVRRGDRLLVEARGTAPFAPRSRPLKHSLAWRLDRAPWSEYGGEWPVGGIPLDTLPSGTHVLEAKARDGLGNEDPTPASLRFEILPVPIQDQVWFRPVLAVICLVFALLAMALAYAARRLRREAGRLEEEVQARTLELREDIARREKAEAESRRLTLAIEQAAEIIIITDASGLIQYVNPRFEAITGYTRAEVLGQNPRILKSGKHDAAFYAEFWGALRQGLVWHGRLINRKKDGTLYTEEATISPVRDETGKTINFVAAKRDITHELRLQEQLVQAQKMESVGRLAGGVAHDFNNMLQAILGNVAMALEEKPSSSRLVEHLEEVQKAALRSADLTRQLLAFARKQTVNPKILDLNETVAGMLKMLQRLIGEDIQLAWLPGRDLWPVQLDPSQLDQVLANLTVNARDAIRGVGKITIETCNVTLEEPQLHLEEIVGDFVRLTVSDTGCGMDRETQQHLFEPFFTTKGVGEGTGLGLATVYGIVKQNGGAIAVYSEVEKGSSFRIYLPRAGAAAQAATMSAEGLNLKGTETVLIVEDEPAILKLGERLLKGLGYQVLSSQRPDEALRMAEQHKGQIDLLISDVIMPAMNGRDLADRMHASQPKLKCLFMSGYTASVIAHHGVLDEGVHFLQKPFSKHELATKVRQALGS